MLYANSSDGIKWNKPKMDTACYIPGQTNRSFPPCNVTSAVKTNIIYPNVIGTGMTKDLHEKNASRRSRASCPQKNGNATILNFKFKNCRTA